MIYFNLNKTFQASLGPRKRSPQLSFPGREIYIDKL